MDWVTAQSFSNLGRLFASPGLPASERAIRTYRIERYIVLPVKILAILFLWYFFYSSNWLDPEDFANNKLQSASQIAGFNVAAETIRKLFVVYAVINAFYGALLLVARPQMLRFIYWMVFTSTLLDGLLLSALIVITGGFESLVYWLYPGLIVRNAICIPVATPQIVINTLIGLFYLFAGLSETAIRRYERYEMVRLSFPPEAYIKARSHLKTEADRPKKPMGADGLLRNRPQPEVPLEDEIPEAGTQTIVLRMAVLWMLTATCYGVQILVWKQNQAEEEAKEFALRQGRLESSGRLAAEVAHQLKNPLAIINNAAFSLKRSGSDRIESWNEKIDIIREEVEKSDRILTQLIGYAQLAEGRVERLNVVEELEAAILSVFPKNIAFTTVIERRYFPNLPVLLMQQSHLREVFVNLLQNAREVLGGEGHILITATVLEGLRVKVTISDNGPGIAPENIQRIFEAYFTTKIKGTGLGLSIVKHNVELYGGTIGVESSPGRGSTFTVQFPAKSSLKLS